MVYLLNFNITYIIILATCFDSLSHLQALISRTIVHIVSQFFVLQFLSKTKNCKTICTIVLEINA